MVVIGVIEELHDYWITAWEVAVALVFSRVVED